MRHSLTLVLPIVFALAAQGGPIDPFIQPNPLPPPQKVPRAGGPVLESQFESVVSGDLFGDFVGTHVTQNLARPRPNPVPPPPPPTYNRPPAMLRPPVIPPATPRPNIIVPWKKVVPSGPLTPRPPGQPRGLLPLPPGYDLEYASVIGETGMEHEFRITEIFDLAMLPTSATTSQGTWLIDWGSLEDFDVTTGRFLLLEAEIPLGELFVPEPGSALLLTTLLALTWRRRA